jgi:hypothetical protein
MEWKRCPCGCPIQSSDGRFTGCPNGGKALAPADPTAGGTIAGEPSVTSVMPCGRCGHMRQQHGGHDAGTGGACQQVDCACPGFVGDAVPVGGKAWKALPPRPASDSVDAAFLHYQEQYTANVRRMDRMMAAAHDALATMTPGWNVPMMRLGWLGGMWVPEAAVPMIRRAGEEEDDR